jgi:prepilin signal peptidase PulO-like enzyme (type II secretory pathway)
MQRAVRHGFTKGDGVALQDITPRIGFLMLVGVVITILFIMSCTTLWKQNYHEGLLFLILGAGLSFVFFRKRKIALAIIGFSFIFVSAGLTAIFHPSILGILLTVGSAAGVYLIALWDTKRDPHHTAKDWKTLFDNDQKS